jgi:hypothetical protein
MEAQAIAQGKPLPGNYDATVLDWLLEHASQVNAL